MITEEIKRSLEERRMITGVLSILQLSSTIILGFGTFFFLIRILTKSDFGETGRIERCLYYEPSVNVCTRHTAICALFLH